jgi:hypothetical protein
MQRIWWHWVPVLKLEIRQRSVAQEKSLVHEGQLYVDILPFYNKASPARKERIEIFIDKLLQLSHSFFEKKRFNLNSKVTCFAILSPKNVPMVEETITAI